jgi:predicted nucleic acid-binding protein
MAEPRVADANPILAALLGGHARQVVFSRKFLIYSPQHTLFEVARYLPLLAEKLGRPEIDLFREFQLLPITACQPSIYDSHVEQARNLIAERDPKDVHVLALALSLGYPIWTNDRDFDEIAEVTTRSTAELLAGLER